jgi:hypothetical protein
MAPHDAAADFDEQFRPLLRQARAFADEFCGALNATFSNEFPESTVVRVIVGTLPLYHGAVMALAEPESALGALALMRPIIENWLHLHFIAGDDEMANSPCRALQLEFGWATLTERLVTANGDPKQIADLKDRMAAVRMLLDERGCVDTARDFRAVRRDARDVGKQLSLNWLPVAWQAASQAAHGSGWEWLLTRTESGAEWTHPDDGQRARWLSNLVLLFDNFAQSAFLLLGFDMKSGTPENLFHQTTQLLAHPILAGSREESLPE